MKLDISVAFDDAEYLIPQTYLYIESLKDKFPKDSVLHITTTKWTDTIRYINNQINSKVYIKPQINELKSRCRYLLRSMEIDSNADYVLKTDLDVLFLKDFDEILNLLKTDADIYIQSENRRIIKDDNIETRIWKQIYKALGYELPDIRIPYVENHELGRPLLNSGAFIIKQERMKELQSLWIDKTKICEKWMEYGIHPNEFALTAMILSENWKWMGLRQSLHFNPIGHFRKGEFPSQELVENCKIPEDMFMLHWHKPQWLFHLAKYNKNISDLICSNEKFIPQEWWDLPLETYNEHN